MMKYTATPCDTGMDSILLRKPYNRIALEIVKMTIATVLVLTALPLFAQNPQTAPESVPVTQTESRNIRKPLLTVKTNLLFDMATALNVELEMPIGKRWSMAGECIFPWWLWEKKQYCLQILSGNLEGRYWFGNRDDRPQLTGWFAGLHLGGGYFDFAWGDKGCQGEYYITAGLSGGYAHTISKNGKWRMEYLLGAGYLSAQYREYNPVFSADEQWHLIHRKSGRYTLIGPTRARISLVWMLDRFYQQKGGAR